MATAHVFDEEYDVVVAGAGSAGCIVATRLTEDPSISLCLLEAGGRDRKLPRALALETASLRFCVSAGEVLPVATWNDWKEVSGVEIIETIGTTELLHAFIHNFQGRNRPGSSGLPLEGYEIKLTDPGNSQPLIGTYNGLTFEADRMLIDRLTGDFLKGSKSSTSSDESSAPPTGFPGGPPGATFAP